jgi:hypothetical protein
MNYNNSLLHIRENGLAHPTFDIADATKHSEGLSKTLLF